MNGFYLYIDGDLKAFIHSDVIPRVNEIIDYNNTLYTVINVRHFISQNKIIGDATITYKVNSYGIYVTDK